uniref:Putative transcriptional regulator n=1 Tax=mine drainage metagenome TaxID=410659 RepID=E6QKC2_9ZZZZ
MRTTLTIDDDVLAAARGLAEAQRKTIGEVITGLARQGLKPAETRPAIRNGIRLLPIQPGSTPVTLELVNQLRDELP